MTPAEYKEEVAPILKELWPTMRTTPQLDVQRGHWFRNENVSDVLEAFRVWQDSHKNSSKPDWQAVLSRMVDGGKDGGVGHGWTILDQVELGWRMQEYREMDRMGYLDHNRVNTFMAEHFPILYKTCKAGPDFRVNRLCPEWVAEHLMGKTPTPQERINAQEELAARAKGEK